MHSPPRTSTWTSATATGSLSTDDLGKVRLEVESRDDKPVFVGIARTSDVEDYLQGVSHSTLTTCNTSPFEADYDAPRRRSAAR